MHRSSGQARRIRIQPARRAEPAVPTLALVIIDEEPLREEALSALRGAESELNRLQHQWAVFRERDKPAFVSWMHSTFHRLFSEIQDLAWQIQEKRALIEAVLLEASTHRIDYAEAYENVMERKKRAESGETDDGAAFSLFQEELREEGIDPGSLDPEELQRRFAAFKARHGFSEDGAEEGPAGEREDREYSGPDPRDEEDEFRRHAPPTEHEKRLKQLYRMLVRRLHPDATGSQDGSAESERDRALWNQVQAAYDANDVTRLESIWAMVCGEAGSATASFGSRSIGELRELLREMIQAVASMRKRIRGAHRDRAWGFSRPSGNPRKKKVYRAVQRELEEERSEMREALDTMDQFIENWIRGAGGPGEWSEESSEF